MKLIIGCDGHLDTDYASITEYAFYSDSGIFKIFNKDNYSKNNNGKIGDKALGILLNNIIRINPYMKDVVIATWGGPEFDTLTNRVDKIPIGFNIKVIDLQQSFKAGESVRALKTLYKEFYSVSDLLYKMKNHTGIIGDAFRIYRIYKHKVLNEPLTLEYLTTTFKVISGNTKFLFTSKKLVLSDIVTILKEHPDLKEIDAFVQDINLKECSFKFRGIKVNLIPDNEGITRTLNKLSVKCYCSSGHRYNDVQKLNLNVHIKVINNSNYSTTQFINALKVLDEMSNGGNGFISYGKLETFTDSGLPLTGAKYTDKAFDLLSFNRNNLVELDSVNKTDLNNSKNRGKDLIISLTVHPYSELTGIDLLMGLWGREEKYYTSSSDIKSKYYNTATGTSLNELFSKVVLYKNSYKISTAVSLKQGAYFNTLVLLIETYRMIKLYFN